MLDGYLHFLLNNESVDQGGIFLADTGDEGLMCQQQRPVVIHPDVNIDLILDDRAKELVGECHRWNDLVRTGKLVERVRMHNDDAAAFIQDFHTVRPIPQDQIDRTIGGYAQNPGYPGS